jgi:sugar phosphate isomerase/epimerase
MQRRSFLGGAFNAVAMASGAAALSLSRRSWSASKPNSTIAGVQVGVITYSFRSMPDQSAEALLRYCRDAGISAIELMGEPAEAYAGLPLKFDQAKLYRLTMPRAPGSPPPSAAEQQEREELQRAMADQRRVSTEWRTTAPIKPFEELRREFNAAGVSIYAFKPSTFETNSTEAEVDYGMRAARALGANHVTVELPTDIAQVRRLGAAARKYGLRVGYHQHTQATPTLWDAALAESAAAGINLDLGHYVAAGDYDGLEFIRQHHSRICSMHLKDRKTRANGQANLPWGEGDTPITAALRLMRDQQYAFPASIELEYAVPAGSDAVREVVRCLEFCRKALTASA